MISLLLKIISAILLLIIVLVLIYRFFFLHHIPPLSIKRLGFTNMPAYPIKIIRLVNALLKLNFRAKAVLQAKFGLDSSYTIKNYTANAFAFCYTKNYYERKKTAIKDLRKKLLFSPIFLFQIPKFLEYVLTDSEHQGAPTESEIHDSKRKLDLDKDGIRDREVDLTALALDHPKQFALSWTQFGNVQERGTPMLETWTNTLLDPEVATKQFFPTIAKYGIAYNLLVLEKVSDEKYERYKQKLVNKAVWSDTLANKLEALKAKGKLYCIDFTIFEDLVPQLTHKKGEIPNTKEALADNKTEEIWRYTPATFTWLEQDEQKQITPFAVHILGTEYPNPAVKEGTLSKDAPNAIIKNKGQLYLYDETKNTTWIYALQAVKVSTTVFGIWLGHVYPWHIVTASMVMTLFNKVKKNQSIYQLVAPHCNHVIGFNNALLLLWKSAAPPTSITTGHQFLQITDKYARGRNFFDDNPRNILAKAGITEKDFTTDPDQPWDEYRIIGYQLKIWDIVEQYVKSYVRESYASDQAVQNDAYLQKWMTASAKKGNIRGLPAMNSKTNLEAVLTSFLYRFTVHGLSRLNNTANPAMTFVGNFPPTLQRTDIPAPSTSISPEELMNYMPRTGTIGRMIDFYFTFADSAPYESLVPVEGIDQHLLFQNVGDTKTKDRSKLTQSGKDKDTDKAAKLNIVLQEFRKEMVEFMKYYNASNQLESVVANPAQIHQWPLCVET